MKLVHIVSGARPNFMKVAPLFHALEETDWAEPVLIHTQQHKSPTMSDAIWQQLQLPPPDFLLNTPQHDPAQQLSHIVMNYQAVLERSRPDATIVVGDVTSTLACAIATRYNSIPLVHAEAGLRSGEADMLEEINRVMVDSVSDLLWTTTEIAKQALVQEGKPLNKIVVIGNLMIDSMLAIRAANPGRLSKAQGVDPARPYVVVTLHRPSNVDDPRRLGEILDAINELSIEIPVFWPVHPRIEARLGDLTGNSAIRILPALSYVDFQGLLEGASLVVTDSGGLQEETTFLGIPCLTVRRSTERPETVSMGTNELVEPSELLEQALIALDSRIQRHPVIPFWDGHAATRACESLAQFLGVPTSHH